MFRDRVVGHFVGRGYRVDADAVLTADNGRKHKVDLLATDSLGRIAVWFGDQEPFEGPELESVRLAARELGAAPAIAAPDITAIVRDNARRLGIVVVDEATIQVESDKHIRPLPPRPLETPQATAYPDWPTPQAPTPRQREPEAVEAPWRKEPEPVTVPAPMASNHAFDWLPEDGPLPTTAGPTVEPNLRRPLMPNFWGPVLITAAVLLTLILILALIL